MSDDQWSVISDHRPALIEISDSKSPLSLVPECLGAPSRPSHSSRPAARLKITCLGIKSPNFGQSFILRVEQLLPKKLVSVTWYHQSHPRKWLKQGGHLSRVGTTLVTMHSPPLFTCVPTTAPTPAFPPPPLPSEPPPPPPPPPPAMAAAGVLSPFNVTRLSDEEPSRQNPCRTSCYSLFILKVDRLWNFS